MNLPDVSKEAVFGVAANGPLVCASKIQRSKGGKNAASRRPRADYYTLCESIKEDLLLVPTAAQYIKYGNQGTIGRTPEGGIVIQDDEGILSIMAQDDAVGEIDELL
jgi:hypothetical protein